MRAAAEQPGNGTPGGTPATPASAEGIRVLAATFYRQARDEGFAPEHVVSFATALLGLVSAELRGRRAAGPAGAVAPAAGTSDSSKR